MPVMDFETEKIKCGFKRSHVGACHSAMITPSRITTNESVWLASKKAVSEMPAPSVPFTLSAANRPAGLAAVSGF